MIPSDILTEWKEEMEEGMIPPKEQCNDLREMMSEFEDTRVSPFCYACSDNMGTTKKYCFNYNAAEVQEKDITR